MSDEVYQNDTSIAALYWFEEASGSRADRSVNGNTLTDNATVTSSSDVKQGLLSAQFTAANVEWLSITNGAQVGLGITGNMTICGWYKPATSGANEFLVGKYLIGNQRSYRVIRTSGNVIEFRVSSNGIASSAAVGATVLSSGTWYHIAGVYDGTDLRVYLQGALDSNGASNPLAYTSGIFNGSGEFTIGKQDVFSNPIDGLMDEWAIFSRALTAAEIASVATKGIVGLGPLTGGKLNNSIFQGRLVR